MGVVIGNLLYALAYVLDIALNILFWLVIIRAILSWIIPFVRIPFYSFFVVLTEPFLSPIRRVLKMEYSPVDISPVILILLIIFVRKGIITSLYEIAMRMK